MKMIINDCYGGFGVRQEVLDELELNGFSEEELRTAARLIEEIENGKDVSDDCAELKVVEIPDESTDYYLDEYDGLESVTYVLNGKLHWA
jgi:hypothetical protein